MTQNAFLSSKVKLHFFFAGQPGSFSTSILSKNVYTEKFYPLTITGIKLWKGSLCWVFSEDKLRTLCNFKITHKGLLEGRKWDNTVNKTTKTSSVCLNSPGHFKTSAVMAYGTIPVTGTEQTCSLPPSFFSFLPSFQQGHIHCINAYVYIVCI